MLRSMLVGVLCAGLGSMAPVAAQQMEDGDKHSHSHAEMRDVGVAAPSIVLKTHPDGGGYNLQIIVGGFRFSPERTGTATDAVEGHAHLYVNGAKKARVYGEWFHLPEEWLSEGQNSIRVTLNDNVHRTWAFKGAPVRAEINVVRKGDFDGELIERRLIDGQPETLPVVLGEKIRIILHSEQAADLHLHGYDLMARAQPGMPAIFTFHANFAGRFAIETHGAEDILGRTEKVLAYIEVRSE